MRVHVGQEQHPRRAFADVGDPADQAFRRDRRMPLGRAIRGPGEHEDGLDEGAAGIRDHAPGDEAERRIAGNLQQAAQFAVLDIERPRHQLPLQEARILLAQLGVLGVDRDEIGDMVGDTLCRHDGLGERVDHRHGDIEHRDAQALQQPRLGASHRDQGNGQQNEPEHRESLRQAPERGREPHYASRSPERHTAAPP